MSLLARSCMMQHAGQAQQDLRLPRACQHGCDRNSVLWCCLRQTGHSRVVHCAVSLMAYCAGCMGGPCNSLLCEPVGHHCWSVRRTQVFQEAQQDLTQ